MSRRSGLTRRSNEWKRDQGCQWRCDGVRAIALRHGGPVCMPPTRRDELREHLPAMNTYDAIIIGTGQAGPSLAARLTASGMRVAVIERGRFGGTCVNTGCTPTKALVASAYAARVVQRASEYGVHISGPAQVDISRVKARKDALVDQSRTSLESWLSSLPNVSVYRGHARFVGPRTVSVGADTLTGERVFIDVGGRPSVPKLPGVDRVPYLTSDSMMELAILPEHLIVGGAAMSASNLRRCTVASEAAWPSSRWARGSSGERMRMCPIRYGRSSPRRTLRSDWMQSASHSRGPPRRAYS